MKLIETCIDRPVFATVLSIIVVLFGVLAYMNLETRYFPNVPMYTLQIDTVYFGANPKLIEESVNAPIEGAMSTISGVDTLTSMARQGQGTVIIRFKTGVDFTEKSSEVREKLSSIRAKLPADITPPVITKWTDGGFLMNIAFTDPNMQPVQIRDYVERYVKDKIQEIPGVGNINIWGANRYAMRIWLNATKMAIRKITVDDVRNALEKSNVQMPGGEFRSKTMSFPINEDTRLQTAQQFDKLIIKAEGTNVVRLKDIGYAKLGLESDPLYARVNGKPAIGMNISLSSGANPIVVSKAIHQQLPLVKNQLPPGMKATIPQDISYFYKNSVFEVYLSIVLSILCVITIILAFLGSLRAVFIPVTTIPICILGAFCFMSLFGFTINMLTLLAIVLSIGLVVDDSIVVLENIHRHIENKLSAYSAAKKGASEIVFPVIAMTLTLVGVYVPIGFLHSRAVLLSREFAFTLAGAVLVSGFVAITLSPMLCSFLLSHKSESRYTRRLEKIFEWLKSHYAMMLNKIITYRWVIILICLGIVGSGISIYHHIPKKFLPSEDTGMVMGNFNTPTGSNSEYTFGFTKQLESISASNPSVLSTFGFAYGNSSQIFLMLKPIDKRKESSQKVINFITKKATNTIPGFNGNLSVAGYNFSEHDLDFYIMTSGNYRDLYKTTQAVIKQLKKYPGLRNVDSNMKFDSQQYNIKVNRDIANTMGINITDIDNTVSSLLGGIETTDFMMGGQSYKVMVQSEQSAQSDPTIINQFYMKNNQGNMVPLSNLVSLKSVLTQQELNHYGRLRSAEIYGQLQPGYQISDAVIYIQANLKNWLPQDTKYAFTGKAKFMLETGNSMNLIFVLGILFIYLILAAQFESFIDPFIILLTVPLSVIGGLVFLKLFGGSLNIYTDIGLITLVGLVSKHGILITQFANKIRETEELTIREAVVKAASIRLRPILMTTGAMIFGAMPLLFAMGFGSNSRSQIGQIIIGGLLFGTFFSLILTPVAYTYLAKFKKVRTRE